MKELTTEQYPSDWTLVILMVFIILGSIALYNYHQGNWSCYGWKEAYSNMSSIPIKWQMKCG